MKRNPKSPSFPTHGYSQFPPALRRQIKHEKMIELLKTVGGYILWAVLTALLVLLITAPFRHL